eukprot:603196-Heterocapsa_arctica.AAC.1
MGGLSVNDIAVGHPVGRRGVIIAKGAKGEGARPPQSQPCNLERFDLKEKGIAARRARSGVSVTGGVTQPVSTQPGGGIAPSCRGDGLRDARETHGGALEVPQDDYRDVTERLDVSEHARKELLVES